MKRTIEKGQRIRPSIVSRPLHGLRSFALNPSSELLGYYQSSANADWEKDFLQSLAAPGTGPKSRLSLVHDEPLLYLDCYCHGRLCICPMFAPARRGKVEFPRSCRWPCECSE